MRDMRGGEVAGRGPSFNYTLASPLEVRKITKENSVSVAEVSWAQVFLSISAFYLLEA